MSFRQLASAAITNADDVADVVSADQSLPYTFP